MPKLIVIGQQQRCGGSLLNRMFDGHSQAAVHPQENYSGRPYKYHLPLIDVNESPENVWKNILEPPMVLVSKFKNSRGYSIKYDFNNHKHLFLENYPSADISYQSIFLHYFDSLFKSISEYNNPLNPKYFLYFTPRQALYSEEIINIFEGSHVIQLLRNPLGFFNSVKSHNRFYDINSAKFIWRLFFFNCLYLKKKGLKNYHLIFFEDLLEQPEKCMRNLCADLDINYEKNLLIPTSGGFEWHGNSHFKKLESIDKSVKNHYKNHLNNNEITFFDKELNLFESLRERVGRDQDINSWDSEKISEGLKVFKAYLSEYKTEKPINTKAYVFHSKSLKLYDLMLGTDGKGPESTFFMITDFDERKTLVDSFEMIGQENSTKIPPFLLDENALKALNEESFSQLFLGILNIYGPKTLNLFLSKYLDQNQLSKTKDNAIQLFKRDPRGISLKSLAFLGKMALRSNDSKRIKSLFLIGKLFLVWLRNIRVRVLIRHSLRF